MSRVGGARPGAGRKPRAEDGRTCRLYAAWTNDEEHAKALTLTPDERRAGMLDHADWLEDLKFDNRVKV